MGVRRFFACLAAITVAMLTIAPAAEATFHLIKVREVYPGAGEDSYVELQMYASGQNALSGHSLTVYSSTGALVHTSTFSAAVAKSENQRTVLIGDSEVSTTFAGVTPDLVDAGLSIPAAGGAVCWNAGGAPADCVAWGNFSGGAVLQSAAGTGVGTPASPSGITVGKAIRRSIAPGCATLLEDSDDTNVSSADFSEVAPTPRSNSATPTETTCPGPPNTAIDDRPPSLSGSATAEFTYEAPTATSYECKLDSAPFSPCPFGGPQIYTGGQHTFQVRGINGAGPDPSPASYTWIVDLGAPAIDVTVTKPSLTSPVSSVAVFPQTSFSGPLPSKTKDRTPTFKFRSGLAGSTFQCRLDSAAFKACQSPFTTKALALGHHTFEVRAASAGLIDPTPAKRSFKVVASGR